ncbi:MAG: pilus assembly protein [Chromatiaceae bacterium]|nr:MAG: pilus assembly protein [Chromatiaceae bacterium]
MRTISSPSRRYQQGTVLAIGLVLLLVITLLGISAMQTTVLQERMAGNLRQTNLALQAAEAALQAALAYLGSQQAPPLPRSGDIAKATSGDHHVWRACQIGRTDDCGRLEELLTAWAGDWAQAGKDRGTPYAALQADTVDAKLPRVFDQPRLYIESRYIPPLDVEAAAEGKGVHFYTVTAIGFGEIEQARVIIQSTIARVYSF